MADLDSEIAAYEGMRQKLESHKMGRWVLVHDGQLIDDYESFEAAAKDAVAKFGRGPYLIRQVGAAAIAIPASVAYFQHGSH